jgi:hypothetical protein
VVDGFHVASLARDSFTEHLLVVCYVLVKPVFTSERDRTNQKEAEVIFKKEVRRRVDCGIVAVRLAVRIALR